jgi:Sperm-tail PG-rich repeat
MIERIGVLDIALAFAIPNWRGAGRYATLKPSARLLSFSTRNVTSMFPRFRTLTFRLVALISLVVLLAAAAPVRWVVAQGGKSVSYDTPVESQITDAAPEEVWTFNATSKDRIAITVERTGGTLLPRFELRDSNNQRLTSADNDDSGARAMLNQIELPGPGTFTIAVGRYQGKDGKTSGNYKLTVALVGAGEDNPILKTQPKPIEYDKAATGELTNARWKESWTFNATGKDMLSVTASRVDGTIRPDVDLLDSAGNSVNHGYIDNTGEKAQISRFRLPGPGQYTVVVQRENKRDGLTAGKYSLMVSLDGAGPERPELIKPLGAVAVDGTVAGTLTDAKWMDVYTLETQSKDRLLLSATRTDGNLIPIVYLMGANSQEITRGYNDPTGIRAQVEVTLPGPGKYEVRVGRVDNEGGATTGKYELAVTVLGTGEDSPTFKTSAGEVKIGTPVKGTLTNAKWQDSWTVNVQGTDPITIVARRTSGTLGPQIRVIGANQQDINYANPDNTFAQSELNQMRLPGPGQYTIVVFRYNGPRGDTTGGYELSVTQGQSQ